MGLKQNNFKSTSRRTRTRSGDTNAFGRHGHGTVTAQSKHEKVANSELALYIVCITKYIIMILKKNSI